jgi:hypothetical protein
LLTQRDIAKRRPLAVPSLAIRVFTKGELPMNTSKAVLYFLVVSSFVTLGWSTGCGGDEGGGKSEGGSGDKGGQQASGGSGACEAYKEELEACCLKQPGDPQICLDAVKAMEDDDAKACEQASKVHVCAVDFCHVYEEALEACCDSYEGSLRETCFDNIEGIDWDRAVQDICEEILTTFECE